MSKVKQNRTAFIEAREKLGDREIVAPAMGTNRITLYRWETGAHPIPPMAFILIGLLLEKYPQGLPDDRDFSHLPVGHIHYRPPAELRHQTPAEMFPRSTRTLSRAIHALGGASRPRRRPRVAGHSSRP